MQIKWRERYRQQRTKEADKRRDMGGNTAAVGLQRDRAIDGEQREIRG